MSNPPNLCLMCGTDLAAQGRHALTKYCAECWLLHRRASVAEDVAAHRQRHKAGVIAYRHRAEISGDACPHLGAVSFYSQPKRQELGGKILLEFPYEDEEGHRYRRCLKCFEDELGYLAI